MSDDCYSVFLGEFHKGSIGEVGVYFDLKSDRFDFALGEQIHEELSIEVADAQMPDISFCNTGFHLCPDLLDRLMIEFS